MHRINQDKVKLEDSEQNKVGGTKKGADSTGRVVQKCS